MIYFQNLQIKKAVQDAISAAKNNGRETCGLLVDNGYFVELIPTKNKAKKGGAFAFYFSEIRQIQKAVNILNREIIGTYHSHPISTCEPGESDIVNAVDDSFMLIIDVMNEKIGLWKIKNKRAKKITYLLLNNNQTSI